MRINQLRQILEIEKCRSISQAARNLYISQPSLSIVLNDFEKEIGVQLFTRSNTGIRPTPDGERLLSMMHEVITGIDNIQSYAQSAQDMTGEVTLYIGPEYDFLIPEITLRFKAVCPKISLYFMDNTIDLPNLVDRVYKHLCSFAVGYALPQAYAAAADSDIAIQPLAEVNMVLLLNAQHRLCQKPVLTLADLFDEQVLLMDSLSRDSLLEQGFFRLPFTRMPMLSPDRLAVFQLLQRNAAVVLSALPVDTETYEEDYPFLRILPFHEQLQTENWPTYLLYNAKMNSRMDILLLEQLKKLLWEKGLL